MSDKKLDAPQAQSVLSDEERTIDLAKPYGKITYADDVIAIIAGLAATEVKGVASMSTGLVEDLTQAFGKKNMSKGVKVEVGSEEAAIDVYLMLEYGVKLIDVTSEVQSNVKKAIETMTGLRVVEVNVYVQGISIPKEAKEEPKKEMSETPRVR